MAGWRLGRSFKPPVVTRDPFYGVGAGGTLYTITPGGTITPAGVCFKAVAAPRSGTITPAGALVRATVKRVAGTVTPAGSAVKAVVKFVAGTVTPGGVLANVIVRLRTFTGTITPGVRNYLSLPSTPYHVSTPHHASQNPGSSTLDLRIHARLTDWTASAVLISKWDAPYPTPCQYILYLDGAGIVNAAWVDNTSSGQFPAATVAHGIPDGTDKWIRCLITPASGTCDFYTSQDGATWTQLGAQITGLSTNAVQVPASPVGLAIGDEWSGSSGTFLDRVYRAQVIIGGATVSDMNFALAGAGTTSLVAATGETWTLTGSANITGASPQQLVKRVSKSLAGVVTPAGSFVKLIGKRLAGTITPAGALANVIVRLRTFAGTITPAGALAKLVGKPLAGTITPAGALARVLTLFRTFAGTITPAGTAVKAVGKSVAGVVTPAGVITRQLGKRCAGTITPAGTIVKAVAKATAGTITSAGTCVKAVGKRVAGTITPTATLGLIAAKVFYLIVSGTVTPAGTLVRASAKTLAGVVTPAGSIIRAVAKRCAGVITPAATLARGIGLSRLFTGTITPAGAVTRSVGKRVAGLLSSIGALFTSTTTNAPVITAPFDRGRVLDPAFDDENLTTSTYDAENPLERV